MRIRVCCPDCGPRTLTREQVQLVISTVPHASRYSFTCPSCRAWVSRPADPPAVVELCGWVPVIHEVAPAELDEPHLGPPIDEDDLIALGCHLAAADELAVYAVG